jgi:hypothetical protein
MAVTRYQWPLTDLTIYNWTTGISGFGIPGLVFTVSGRNGATVGVAAPLSQAGGGRDDRKLLRWSDMASMLKPNYVSVLTGRALPRASHDGIKWMLFMQHDRGP